MSSLAGRRKFATRPELSWVAAPKRGHRLAVLSVEAAQLLDAALLPEQFARGPSLYAPWVPKLMFAILEDALKLAAWGEPQPWWTLKRRALHAWNEAWFHDVTSDGPFSIETVCDVLSLSYRTVMRVHARLASTEGLNPGRQRLRPVRPAPPVPDASGVVPLRPPRGCGGMVITWAIRQTS